MRGAEANIQRHCHLVYRRAAEEGAQASSLLSNISNNRALAVLAIRGLMAMLESQRAASV